MSKRDFVRTGADLLKKNTELVRLGSEGGSPPFDIPPVGGQYSNPLDMLVRDAGDFILNKTLYPLVDTAGIDYLYLSDVRSGTTDFEVTSNYLSVDDAGTLVGILRNRYLQLVDE